jgi:hypothetical protein
LSQFHDGKHCVTPDLRVRIIEGSSQGIRHGRIGIAHVPEFEHRFTTNLWLGIA